jgi:hypothetical protein
LQILEDSGKILVIPVLCTILVIPGFWKILVIPVLQILENTCNTYIADTGRFWKILVIPVLQILEDS